MNRKASITMYLTMIMVAIVIIVIAAVMVPMGIMFNAEAYAAGEYIMQQGNRSIQSIDDANVRNTLTDTVQSAYDSAELNIEVNAAFFKYSWILVIGLTALIAFIFTRRVAEYRSGGFV